MQWTEADSTGNETLDQHHRMLFRMTEDFRLALAEGRGRSVYGVLLDSAEAFARGHFSVEERLAETCRSPLARRNAEAHRWFLAEFARFRERYRQHGFLEQDASAACTFLEDWLHDHIRHIDTHLGDGVAGRPAADRRAGMRNRPTGLDSAQAGHGTCAGMEGGD